MSDSSERSWSNNPNSPQIPYSAYSEEKANFAGVLIGAIFYGIAIVLFFRCMSALLDPADRTRGGFKWVLVAHTTVMFSFVTMYTAINLNVYSVSYIDDREFPGSDVLPPEPLAYQWSADSRVINVTRAITFFMNHWLADGLLLYRCHVIYGKKHWIIAFPCLMYLASLAMGIMVIHLFSQRSSDLASVPDFGTPFYSISFSLNILLTLMIVARLVLHSRNFRNAMGTPTSAVGSYKTVITMLVESCALYAVAFVLFIGPWGASSYIDNVVFPVLAEVQVIAPLLIILRVANRSALTSDTVVSGTVSSIRFSSRDSKPTGDNGSLPCGSSVASTETGGGTLGEPHVGAQTVINFNHDD